MLNSAAGIQFPAFEKFTARRYYMNDNPDCPSLRIDVFLRHKGRVNLCHSSIFGYDEEEKKSFGAGQETGNLK